MFLITASVIVAVVQERLFMILPANGKTCWEDSVTDSHSRTFHASRHVHMHAWEEKMGVTGWIDPSPKNAFYWKPRVPCCNRKKQTCSPGHQKGLEYDRAKHLCQCHEWTWDSSEILSGCCAEASYLQVEIYSYIGCRLLMAVVYRWSQPPRR